MPAVRTTPASVRLWRRLVPAQLVDAWLERVRWAAPHAPIVTEFPSRPTARLEIYGVNRAVAQRLQREYGGEIRIMSAADWLAPQARDFVLALPGALVVASESASIPPRQAKLPVLRIPAGMAFGTGEHATTALCLRQLAQEIASRRARGAGRLRVLDAGTGSGVLALAAATLGAEVEAFDFDSLCIRECRANARRNPQAPRVRWRLGDVLRYIPESKSDILVANLTAGLLVKALPRMKRWLRAGGCMILSGVLRVQEAEVAAALWHLGLRPARVLRKGRWVCFSGVVRASGARMLRHST